MYFLIQHFNSKKMKKLSILFSAGIFITSVLYINTVYNYSVPKIEGGSQSLSAYQGKKLLLITLPVAQDASADSLLYSLDTLAAARAASLKVIAVPSYEDGFTDEQKIQLKQWYRSKLSSNIVITDGLYTRRSSGNQQHPLFKWLTTMVENEIFDVEMSAPGCKFFTNSNGQLYGVLKERSKMWGGSVQKTLGMQ